MVGLDGAGALGVIVMILPCFVVIMLLIWSCRRRLKIV
jgi:hypothetical protein